MSQPVFRFAPSPNGRLHLGHAFSALLNFDMARRAGGRFRVRMEDIDATRCRPEFEAAIYEDLAWLGLQWEQPVRRQSEHLDDYRAALTELHGIGPWTADIYLLFCLGNADAWPAGDLALQEAARLAFGLRKRPDAKAMGKLGEKWRPWRGVAAHLLWAYYHVVKRREGAPVPGNAKATWPAVTKKQKQKGAANG